MSVEWKLARVCQFVKTNYNFMYKKLIDYWTGRDLPEQGEYTGTTIAMRRTAVFMHFVGAMFFASLLYVGYLSFIDTAPPITVSNEPLPVSVEEITSGDLLEAEVDVCRTNTKPVDISLTWYRINDNGYFAGESFENLVGPIGCHTSRVGYIVPKSLVPGVYTLQMNITYSNNALHTETIEVETEQFIVNQSIK